MKLGAEEKFRVGQPPADKTEIVLGSLPTTTKGLGAIFEDDGTTGYFYAVEQGQELELLDALHVYDVVDVADTAAPITAQIFWNEAETAAVLLLNGYSWRIRLGARLVKRSAVSPDPSGRFRAIDSSRTGVKMNSPTVSF